MTEVDGAAADPATDFDVIVVGAGIAGCITARQLAELGHSVLLIERGATPGSKNLSGGVLYCQSMQEIFPSFLTEAPVERRINRNYLAFLNTESSVGIDYRDSRLAEPANAVTVLRAKLDPWLSQQCEEKGVFVMPGVRVDRVLTEPGPSGQRVVGVQAGDDRLRAHVVVAAGGVNSFLAEQVGLRPKQPLKNLATAVKCVVRLPAETIESRFGVRGDEGAAFALVGDCTQGVGGGGFLYTNTDSVSVGIVLRLDDLVAKKKSATDIFDHFLAHPFLAPYLEAGEVAEYGCHMIAEGGMGMIGRIEMDGMVVVGEAAGLSLNTGFTVRGMDLAVASGVAAAAGIDTAPRRGDTSGAGLAGYRENLFASFAGHDMRTYARAPSFFETPRVYQECGELLGNLMYGVFNLDNQPRRHLASVAFNAFRNSPVKVRHLLTDAVSAVRAL